MLEGLGWFFYIFQGVIGVIADDSIDLSFFNLMGKFVKDGNRSDELYQRSSQISRCDCQKNFNEYGRVIRSATGDFW